MKNTKRKHDTTVSELSELKRTKKSKLSAAKASSKHKDKSRISSKSGKQSKTKTPSSQTDLVESDTTESENGFYGFSAKESSNNQLGEESSDDDGQGSAENGVAINGAGAPELPKLPRGKMAGKNEREKLRAIKNGVAINTTASSRETHAKQKELAKERRAAKPNADIIQRSKRLWERLRRKSHVPKDERKQLVDELFSIVNGRVHDFVFKHDSVRVIQCALKYANPEQRAAIAKELEGEYKNMAQSKYAKFLVAKLIIDGDPATRASIIEEFYGHVRRLINHPEAAWIIDDIYRQIATQEQKAILLREWYGPEFAIFKASDQGEISSDLSTILSASPEKRKPIMTYLYGLINQLIQKKLTGFTMLHDAMLQYFENAKASSEQANEFILNLQSDEESDLLKNLAFTPSGSRVACLALAYGSAKDRRHILKAYKDTVELLAYDPHGYKILLTMYDVVDDTVMISKSIILELITKLSPKSTQEQIQKQHDTIFSLATHNLARTAILYPFTGPVKWLLPPGSAYLNLLPTIEEIRITTSKKPAKTRYAELAATLHGPLLSTVTARASDLSKSSFGCQFIAEMMLAAPLIGSGVGTSDSDTGTDKTESAATAIAALCAGSPETDDSHIANSAAGCRMLKTLVAGGRFDPALGKVVRSEPQKKAEDPSSASEASTGAEARAGAGKGFASKVWQIIKEEGTLREWACGSGAFVIVALVEVEGFEERQEVLAALKKMKKKLKEAAISQPEEASASSTGMGDKDEKKRKNKNKNKVKEKPEKGNNDGDGEEKRKSEKEQKEQKRGKGNAGTDLLLRILESSDP